MLRGVFPGQREHIGRIFDIVEDKSGKFVPGLTFPGCGQFLGHSYRHQSRGRLGADGDQQDEIIVAVAATGFAVLSNAESRCGRGLRKPYLPSHYYATDGRCVGRPRRPGAC